MFSGYNAVFTGKYTHIGEIFSSWDYLDSANTSSKPLPNVSMYLPNYMASQLNRMNHQVYGL